MASFPSCGLLRHSRYRLISGGDEREGAFHFSYSMHRHILACACDSAFQPYRLVYRQRQHAAKVKAAATKNAEKKPVRRVQHTIEITKLSQQSRLVYFQKRCYSTGPPFLFGDCTRVIAVIRSRKAMSTGVVQRPCTGLKRSR